MWVESLGTELNSWIAAAGGLAVVLTVGLIMQRWHEFKVRQYLRLSLGEQVEIRKELGALKRRRRLRGRRT